MKKIRLFATVRDIAGSRTLAIPFKDGDTVHDMIQSIDLVCPALGAKLLDENGQLSSLVHIYVRGRNVEWLAGLDTPVAEQDDVFLVPPMAGG